MRANNVRPYGGWVSFRIVRLRFCRGDTLIDLILFKKEKVHAGERCSPLRWVGFVLRHAFAIGHHTGGWVFFFQLGTCTLPYCVV